MPDPDASDLDLLRRTNEDLTRSLSELSSVRSAFRRILSAHDPQGIAALLFEEARTRFGEVECALWLWDFDRQSLAHLAGSEAIVPDPALVEWAFQQERPATVPSDDGWMTLVPLTVMGRRVGVLLLRAATLPEEITAEHHELLAEIAAVAAAALANADLLARVRGQMTLLANVLDSITNGILVVDREGRVTQLNRNATAMLDASPGAAGAPVDAALPADVRDVVHELIEELDRQGFVMERMMIRKTATAGDLPLAVSAAPLLGEDGSRSGTIFIFRDMTASRELERLRRLDQMKSEFVANVSHELKTPLTSIRAYTEALQDMADSVRAKGGDLAETGATMREFLDVVIEEADRLLGLINDLLNVARIQAGKLKLNLSKVHPHSIVTEILKLSKVQSDKHQIVLELADGLPEIVMDKEKMKEVTINLLSNAIKYSPKGGKVWVRMNMVEGNLRLEVEDQGIGIAPEHREKVFEQFFRVDSSLTYEVPGTGLGLAIVKAIVDAHGGKIELRSELGKGSAFTVWLPARTQWKPHEMSDETFTD